MACRAGARPYASTGAAPGGAGRVLLGLHGGERRWLILLIETGLGALPGIIAASAVTYLAPSLRDAGWGLLIVGGEQGCQWCSAPGCWIRWWRAAAQDRVVKWEVKNLQPLLLDGLQEVTRRSCRRRILANFISVLLRLDAASAITVVDPTLCVRRVRFVTVSPVSRQLCRRQAQNPSIVPSEFPAPLHPA